MRYSKYLIPTLKEIPKDAEIASHRLMLRAGFIQRIASGIYTFLPLGLRVISKFQDIVRREMDRSGALEVLFPSVIPEELWQRSGRWDAYGDQLLKMKDRVDRGYCYGPTHEEVVSELANAYIKSYKQLPLNLYQIQTKFRDEIRPRFGLMRAREFSMKDAYSFHASEESLNETYDEMKSCYFRIFQACGLDVQAVEADSGDIGGSESSEFMVVAETGEDSILKCNKTGNAVNLEAAKTVPCQRSGQKECPAYELIETPGMSSIEDVSTGMGRDKSSLIKSLLYRVDDELVLVMLRGDHDLNELKLKNELNAVTVTIATPKDIKAISGAAPGFLGPINLLQECRVMADHTLDLDAEYVVGANKEHYHIDHVQLSRDVEIERVCDLRLAIEGDVSPSGGIYEQVRGIEVGHIFKLGDKYSNSMGASFMNEEGRPQPFLMGCYGVGIGRTVAAAIEQHCDDCGMVWPKALAPFQVHLICVNPKNDDWLRVSEQVYGELLEAGVDVLYDDRRESSGKKFQDADLIGIPLQIIVGKSVTESNQIELKVRYSGERNLVAVADILSAVTQFCDGH